MVEVRNNPIAGAKPTVNEERDKGVLSHDASIGDWPRRADGTPDFDRMTSQHRQAFDAARLKRKFG